MKLLKSKLLAIVPIIFLLFSCGIDMRDWPYVDLKIDCASIDSIYISHIDNNKGSSNSYFFTDEYAIRSVYDFLESAHANPKTITKDLSDFDKKISFYFIDVDNKIFDFKVYIYGITSYFSYDDSIRKFPADFESTFITLIDNLSDYIIKN